MKTYFVVGSSGIGLDLRGDPPKLGSAQKEITLVGGRTYRIVGTLSFRSSYADSHIGIGLMSGNDDPVTLCYFDGIPAIFPLTLNLPRLPTIRQF